MNQGYRHLFVWTLVLFISLVSCDKIPFPPGGSHGQGPDGKGKSPAMVLAWNEAAVYTVMQTQAVVPDPPIPPFIESRYFAMVNIAIHDALNSIRSEYKTYALHQTRDKKANPDAAVAQAAYEVIVACFDKLNPPAMVTPQPVKDYISQLLQQSLNMIPNSEAKTSGINIGKKAAAAILAKRANDGMANAFLPPGALPEGTEPGEYRYTPPFNIPGLPIYGLVDGTGWGNVTPFAMNTGSQFRPGAPDDVSSEAYAKDFNEIKKLGCANCPDRTADQSDMATFWRENSPMGWNQVGRNIVSKQNMDAWEVARMFALLQIAEADAYISSLEAKYHYFYWRPVSAIHLAADDDNPNTAPDPGWEVFGFPTPPVPDYPSAHACAGGAAAELMKHIFRKDNIGFSFTSTSSGTTRNFNSLSHAARENSLSRIYIGYHFRKACLEGEDQGRKIGKWVFNNVLQKN